MANFTVDGYIGFRGSDDGTTLTPSGNWFTNTSTSEVVDDNADGDIDPGDYWQTPFFDYSGFTIDIGGKEYAIFVDGPFYYVPYNTTETDLSGLSGTSISQTITATPENAVVVNCFAAETLISTPQGDTRIDTIQIGDPILTTDGRTVPVKWVGRSTVLKALAGPKMEPVCIRAGSLGEGVPHSDLTVTADHGMIVEGLVVNAGALVNGTTITWVPLSELPARVTYYHIETEAHDVILANGAPSETFIDYTSRQSFDNYAEYIALYGAERIIADLPMPRVSTSRQLPPDLRTRFGIDWSAEDASDDISVISKTCGAA